MTTRSEQPLLPHLSPWVTGGLVIVLLYLGREVLIPLALATFFCLLLSPAAGFLERHARLGRAISALLVVALSAIAVGLIGWMIGRQGAQLAGQFPQYRDTVVSKIRTMRESVSGKLTRATSIIERLAQETGGALPELAEKSPLPRTSPDGTGRAPASAAPGKPEEEPVKVELVPQEPNVIRMLSVVLGPIVHPLVTLSISTVLLLFFLINRQDLGDRIIRLCGMAQISVTTAALDDCSRRVLRFLLAQAFANCLIGAVIGCGLYFIGIPDAAFWGLLIAVVRFFPYVGSITATLLPFLISIAIFDGWQRPLFVITWCILVDVLSANILEPLLYGARTGVSPTAILLSFVFWTWLWGPYGLFLATPITVCLVVAGKHIDTFESLYILFSDEPVLEPATRFYQRLLACDDQQAVKVATGFAELGGATATFDEVIFPGLAQIEYDRHSLLIDDRRSEFALETAKALLDSTELNWPENAGDESSPAQPRTVALVTNSGYFDSLIGRVFQKLSPGVTFKDVSHKGLVSEVVEDLAKLNPQVVILSGIEPSTFRRVRHAFRRLRERCPPTPVLVLVFTASKRTRRAASRLVRECGAEGNLTLSSALSQLNGPIGNLRRTIGNEITPASPAGAHTVIHAME